MFTTRLPWEMPVQLLFDDFTRWLGKQQTDALPQNKLHQQVVIPFDLFYKDFANWLANEKLAFLAHKFWEKLSPAHLYNYNLRAKLKLKLDTTKVQHSQIKKKRGKKLCTSLPAKKRCLPVKKNKSSKPGSRKTPNKSKEKSAKLKECR